MASSISVAERHDDVAGETAPRRAIEHAADDTSCHHFYRLIKSVTPGRYTLLMNAHGVGRRQRRSVKKSVVHELTSAYHSPTTRESLFSIATAIPSAPQTEESEAQSLLYTSAHACNRPRKISLQDRGRRR